jgi:hypothetical protein
MVGGVELLGLFLIHLLSKTPAGCSPRALLSDLELIN